VKKTVAISILFSLIAVAAAVMLFDVGFGLDIAHACVPGDGHNHGPSATDLTPLWIFLGVVAVCAVLILIIVVRNKKANKKYKQRQKKKQMKRNARD